jgi:ABC-type uncharacterized transport system permease subunit
MDMQVMMSLDKTLYEGLSRLIILTGIFVCLQMSEGQIQQQETIFSLLLLLNTISGFWRFF